MAVRCGVGEGVEEWWGWGEMGMWMGMGRGMWTYDVEAFVVVAGD